MKLTGILKFLFSITILALVYIHMQMQIFDLAYIGKDKEKKVRQLIEANARVTHSILTLKSSNNLGEKLLAENSNMKFSDASNIMQLSAPVEYFDQENFSTVPSKTRKLHALLSFLGSGAQAEANSR